MYWLMIYIIHASKELNDEILLVYWWINDGIMEEVNKKIQNEGYKDK